jgi:hypothetical protein
MATRIQIRRDTEANWNSVNPVLAQGELGINLDNNKMKLGNGVDSWTELEYNPFSATINDLADVVITDVASGDFLRYNGSASAWINDPVNLSTDTVGDYVQNLTAGTGVTLSNNSGEGATPTVAIGQDVATSASVQFAKVTAPVTGNLTGNADTATALQTARVITLSGDVSGSVSFNGTGNVDISTTIGANSVLLGADTIGDYVSSLVAGTGVSLVNNSGEAAAPTISIGQDVATSASVTFVQVDTTGDVTVGGNLTVNGTTTTLNTETLSVEDNIVVLNSNATGSPALNAGIEVERGDSANVVLRWNESTDKWETTNDGSAYSVIATNGNIALGTDTTGNYMSDVSASTGVTISHTPGEGSTATFSIGQPVGTSASVTFANVSANLVGNVTGDVSGNSGTATALQNSRVISIGGDVSGSVSFNGTSDVTISAAIQPNSVALGTDTTGNFVNDVTAGTGVSVTHTPGEGSSPTIAIGQAVGTSSSVQFAAVTAPLIGNSSTATTLENARTISLAGDVSGSVSFNGSSDVSISATIQPNSVALGTDTSGDYVSSLVAGTGVALTNNSGENATPTIAIGQAVGTSASVTFGHVSAPVTGNVTGDLTGNADTATALETARTISLSGDISGSASFDGTTNINIVTDISGSVSGVDSISNLDFVQFDTTANTTPVTGLLGWDSVNGTLNLGLSANKHIHIGEESLFRVRNTTGTTIGKGTALYASGVEPSGRIQVTPYVADGTVREVRFMGLAAESIADGVNGFVQHFGHVRDLDTRGTSSTAISVGDETWAAGDILYVHPTVPGKLTNVAPRHAIVVALVIVRHQTTGWLFVRYSSGGHIDDIHDIVLTSPTDGQFLRYNSASTVWVNDTINLGTDTAGDYVQSLVAGTGVTLSNNSGEGATPTVAIGQDVSTGASVVFQQVETTGSLIVGQNIYVSGSVVTENQVSLEIDDPFIYLNTTASAAGIDTGVVASYFDVSHKHAGYFRDSTDGKFKFFDSYTPEPSSPINTSDISYSPAPVVAEYFESLIANGTAPLTVSSSTVVTNLNADKLDGQDGSYYAPIDSPTFTGTVSLPNNTVALGTQTTGNYVADVSGGTGVTITHTPGEGTTPSVAIGQDVATSASVTFAAVTAPVVGNASTASTLQTPRTISLSGDISGSVSFNGSSNVDISATIQPNSVSLGTDTTGNYVNDLTAGTGVTVTHTPGEGSSPTVAIGQAVGTSSSVQFAAVTAPLIGNVTGNADTATALATSRTIELTGDVTGSVSFNGSANASIAATIQPNSVALGTDTTGNYVNDLTGGTGVTITHTPGEGSSPTVAIGQSVATSASVTFAKVDTTGDVVVGGNLTVNGTTTTLNTETLAIEDNIVVLNSNVTGSPTTNAGIEVERGTSSNVSVRWNETSDKWELTEDGSTYLEIATDLDLSTIVITSLDDIADVSASTAVSGDFLKWNGAAWINDAINLGTDTTGNYVSGVFAGTGITVSHTPGEGSSASVALNATLDDLSGVNAPSLTDGDFLRFISRPTSYIGTTWTTRRSHFGLTSIRSVAYGNSLWVAGGYAGQLRTSTDAITWTTRTSNFGAYDSIYSVAYGNSLWVAGGGNGQLRTSTDAVTWTTRTSNFGGQIRSVAYGNNLWVAGGEYGQIRTSTDGTTWTTRTSNFTYSIYSVAYGNSLWVAAGYYGQLRTSTDAITWTTQTSNFGTTPIRSVAYGNNLWVAGGYAGQLRTSTDAITWTTRTPNLANNQSIHSLVYSNSLWVAGTIEGQIRTSTDGTTWTTQTSNFGSSTVFSVAYGDNTLVAVGDAGKLRTSADTAAFVEWVPVSLDLDDIGDVVITNPSNGNPLVYDNNTSKWKKGTSVLNLDDNYDSSYITLDTTNGMYVNTGTSNTYAEYAHDGLSFYDQNAQSNVTLSADNGLNITDSNNNYVNLSTTSIRFSTPENAASYYINPISASVGQVLAVVPNQYSTPGGTFTPTTLNLDSLGDVSASAPADGEFLKYVSASSAWVPAAVPTINALDDIGDVSASAPVSGDFLKYDGAAWVNDPINLGTDTVGNYVADVVSGTGIIISHTPGEGSSASVALNATLDDLSNVAAPSPTDGHFLKYVSASSAWIPAAVPTINALDDIGNVNAPSPTDGQVLKYVSASSAWVAADATGGAAAPTTTSITANTATTIESFALSAADSAEFTVKVKQGARRESIKALVLHNGTTVDLVQYGEISIAATEAVAGTGATTWTTRTSNFGATNINSVAYGNNLWVAGGFLGQLRTSTDGTTWTTSTSNFGNTRINSVAYGNNLFVAGGHSGQLRTSTDAITWTTRTANFEFDIIYSVAYGNNLWVAGGDFGIIRTSTDGTTWTTRVSNFSNVPVRSVAYGNNLWVAAGNTGRLRTSTDGVTWTTQVSGFGSTNILSVAFGNNLWVAGGEGAQMRTSTDAVTWTTRTSNFGYESIISIAYGNSVWVATGTYGQLRTSTDGTTWTTQTSTFGNTDIRSVAYANNLWVSGGYAGQLRTSAATTASVTVPLTLSADISGSDVRLRATITDAATTNAEVKVLKTVL